VYDCSHIGDCLPDCEYWEQHLPQLKRIHPDEIRRELRNSGAWADEELADEKMNRIRILWIAACECKEEHTCTAYFG
jgi:hypothetical protein